MTSGGDRTTEKKIAKANLQVALGTHGVVLLKFSLEIRLSFSIKLKQRRKRKKKKSRRCIYKYTQK